MNVRDTCDADESISSIYELHSMILTAIANTPNRPVLLSRSEFIEMRCRRRPERDAEDAVWHGEWGGGISLPQPTRIWKSVLNVRGRAPAAHAFLALSERHRTRLVMRNYSGYILLKTLEVSILMRVHLVTSLLH